MKQKQPKTKSTPESPGKDETEKGPEGEKNLQEALNTLQKDRDSLFEKLQRVSADYANYEKRVPKLIADSVAYERERLIKSFLPTLDNFDHTLQADHSVDNVEAMVKGIQIIYDQILGIFKSHGVEQIESVNKIFNPAQHEAMMQRSEEGKENNLVLEEFQKGYILNGRVIRPSKVIVNKLTEESTEEPCPDRSSKPRDLNAQ